MSTTVHMARAFPRGERGGNPAGVVLDPEGVLSEARMLAIAAEVGASETAFVRPTADGHRIRFFTPRTEVPLCGHGTIATYGVLATLGLAPGTYTMHTAAGPQQVSLLDGGWVRMSQNVPVFGALVPRGKVAAALGIDGHHLLVEPRLVSTGLFKVHARVASRALLDGLDPDWDAILHFGEVTSSTGIFVHTLQTEGVESTARCRNFSSAVGAEDPATGTACGGLASLLVRRGEALASEELLFEQGDAVGRPSTIRAEITTTGDRITAVAVSGRAVLDEARTIA